METFLFQFVNTHNSILFQISLPFFFFASKLQTLFLCDLPAVKDMDKVLGILGGELPSCEIRYLSLEGLKDLKSLGKDKDFKT